MHNYSIKAGKFMDAASIKAGKSDGSAIGLL
jgi:hypothetical protein